MVIEWKLRIKYILSTFVDDMSFKMHIPHMYLLSHSNHVTRIFVSSRIQDEIGQMGQQVLPTALKLKERNMQARRN